MNDQTSRIVLGFSVVLTGSVFAVAKALLNRGDSIGHGVLMTYWPYLVPPVFIICLIVSAGVFSIPRRTRAKRGLAQPDASSVADAMRQVAEADGSAEDSDPEPHSNTESSSTSR